MDLKEFIKENKLEFNKGSQGDINITTLCGYALYKGYSINEVISATETTENTVIDELRRVYEFGKTRNYGKWWEHPGAKTMWKF